MTTKDESITKTGSPLSFWDHKRPSLYAFYRHTFGAENSLIASNKTALKCAGFPVQLTPTFRLARPRGSAFKEVVLHLVNPAHFTADTFLKK